MSENILIGKSRKTGKWVLIGDPDDGYDKLLKAYLKIAQSQPVNDEFSKVRLGRIQNTSTPLTLISTDEKKVRDASLKESAGIAANAGKSAEERQSKMDDDLADRQTKAHLKALDEKNALINSVRKVSGQEVFDKTKTEQAAEDFRERLAKAPPVAVKPAEQKTKTHAEELSEKNKLVAETKAASEKINSEKK